MPPPPLDQTLDRANSDVVLIVGASTGRDGIHGATFASAELADDREASRPNVQVDNPFLEKLLLEACLALLPKGVVRAMQDLGAAGLTSSSVEVAARGKRGMRTGKLEIRLPQPAGLPEPEGARRPGDQQRADRQQQPGIAVHGAAESRQ